MQHSSAKSNRKQQSSRASRLEISSSSYRPSNTAVRPGLKGARLTDGQVTIATPTLNHSKRPSVSLKKLGECTENMMMDVQDAGEVQGSTPASIQHAPAEDSEEYAYWNALNNVTGLYRLDEFTFVIQDWDTKNGMLKIGVYYHLARLPRTPTLYDSPHPLPPAILLQKTPFHDTYIFSCQSSTGRHDSSKRTLVTYQRSGRWYCQSCQYSEACKHYPHAAAFARDASMITIGDDPEALPVVDIDADWDVESTLLLQAACRKGAGGVRDSISHRPIPPPRWSLLPGEVHRPRAKLGHHISLDGASRCSCGFTLEDLLPGIGNESPYDPGDACAARNIRVLHREATLYGQTRSRKVTLELIGCPRCQHQRRHIGPDLCALGAFNWSNTILFEHELMNMYSNFFTASETPFSAFCLMMRRNYQEGDHDEEKGADIDSQSFCSEDTFVRAWFAFIQLQELDSGMACPQCGPAAKIVIADGISLGIHNSKIKQSVRPPTHIDKTSQLVESISSYKARSLATIPHPDVRSAILKLVDAANSQQRSELPTAGIERLQSLYAPVYQFICLYFACSAASPYRRIYEDLIKQVAAPDIVLQLIPVSSIDTLDKIAQYSNSNVHLDLTPFRWIQSTIPSIGRVINIHLNASPPTPLPLPFTSLLGWLATRATEVYTRLAQHDPADPVALDKDDWTKTGTYYGLPTIRRRRGYPKLRDDLSKLDHSADAEESGDCNKFYKTYSKNSLSGGILVLWCTHSICLGFHSIPIAEGRNDVFSAIYTHFPTAPEVVVYDFACQLAPYCLVREARYFSNTRFLIDELHAHDHTRCGRACFASNYMQFDGQIRAVNTSAAECGNKGMKRIRKSVSFMIQDHAVVFTKAFLDIWNRDKINRMKVLQS